MVTVYGCREGCNSSRFFDTAFVTNTKKQGFRYESPDFFVMKALSKKNVTSCNIPRLPFPGWFRNADPIVFYGAKIWSVSCRLRNPDLMTKHNLGISISCFDFGSSHADPKRYKLLSWFITISDGF
jgi:hypothetical protein